MDDWFLKKVLMDVGFGEREAHDLRYHFTASPIPDRVSLVDNVLEAARHRTPYPIRMHKVAPSHELMIAPNQVTALLYNFVFDESRDVRRELAAKIEYLGRPEGMM